WLPRLAGKPTVLNVDGLDRKRRKWNGLGRAYLWLCEWLALVTPTAMVTDARVMQEYYRKRYGKHSTLIAYGAEPRDRGRRFDVLERYALEPGHYILYVSRLEPENNPELVLRAYARAQTDWPLVMVGGNPYRANYVERLKRLAGRGVAFTGPVYGEGYWQLQRHAGLYVHATEVGGTHPALIEAMACENAVLYLNTPENAEVAGEAGVAYEALPQDLAAKLERLLADDRLRAELGEQARLRAAECYNWETITSQYEELFVRLVAS
ncbi:MAG: glycosyltransferase, partial [Acidobacteria bacterium]|nr:glycosyltransferase [Acidobacteriota bacterium]